MQPQNINFLRNCLLFFLFNSKTAFTPFYYLLFGGYALRQMIEGVRCD
jgi:hypothetical protein